MTWEEFKDKVKLILWPMYNVFNIEFLDDMITYNVYGQNFSYTIKEFKELNKAAKESEFVGLNVLNQNTIEIPLMALTYQSRSMDRLKDIGILEDKDLGITYEVHKASDLMIYNILYKLDASNYEAQYLDFSNFPEKKTLRLFNLLRNFLNWPYTMTIRYKDRIYNEKLISLARSYLFSAAYNFDYYVRLAENLEDVLGPRLKGKIIKHRSDEIKPPNQIYKDYVLEQYNMAASSRDPMIQFIGYYHVMEYFFDQVYELDLLEGLKSLNKEPDFSLKRENDLKKIIKLFDGKYPDGKAGDEKKKLEMVLSNYVSIDSVVCSIELNNEKMIAYYKDTEVPFAGKSKVDLKSSNKGEIISNLKNRIYDTRNSLVHGKSYEFKSKDGHVYNPYKHEEALKKEIPLMKAIAEQVIIKTGKDI